ncbi:hypothetical protein ACA910_013032 [Epithemia clementina (nom. ined.)]
MEAPKSPISDSYISSYTSTSFISATSDGGGGQLEAAESQGSSPSKRAARLSDRIQHRLNKRGTPMRGSPASSSSGGGPIAPPLSPHSDNGLVLPSSFGSREGRGIGSFMSDQSSTASSSRLFLQKKKLNRSYEERVNSLLLTREEEDSDEEGTKHGHDLAAKTNDTNFVTPSSTIDQDFKEDPPSASKRSADSIDLSIQGSASSDEDDRDSSTHYSTPDDEDGSSGSESASSSSRSTQDASTVDSRSTMSGTVETGRSFSPIYEGMNKKSKKKKSSLAASKREGKNKENSNKETTKSSEDKDTISKDKDNKTPEPEKPDSKKPTAGSQLPPPPLPSLNPNERASNTTNESAEKTTDENTKPPADENNTTSTEGSTTNDEDSPARTNTSSPKVSKSKSFSPTQRSPRTRIPGGAAAKLMLLGPRSDESDEEGKEGAAEGTSSKSPEEDDEDDVEIPKEAVDEIGLTLSKSKNEFSVGSEGNRRYYPPSSTSREDPEDSNSGSNANVNTKTKTGPSYPRASHLPHSTLFDRTEIFHQTATAAVLALLTPRSSNAHDLQSVTSGGAPTTIGSGPPSEIQSALSMLSTTPSVMSSAFQAPTDHGASGTFESLARRDVSLQLITEETEKKLERLKDTMRDPNKTLADLLTSIHTSEDFEPDLGFTVRRKNACGALQVMTAQVERRIPIAWTVGVLPALTSVLRDTGEEGIHASYPDKRHRVEFEAARNRAIACLMNLSTPPKNRIAIFHTPGLVQWLIAISNEGQGIPRKGACAILAYLGKTTENKLLMVQVPGLVDALEKVLKPRPKRFERMKVIEKKIKEYASDDDGSEKEGITSVTSSFSNDSELTPRFSGSHSPVEVDGYDETADELLRAARQNVFALLIHLVKEKDNAYHLARHDLLTATLSAIANFHDSPSHLLAVKVLAALTRHRLNTKILVFKQRDVVPALVNATTSKNDSTRLFSCYALQNLAQDKSCRQELAVSPGLISAICDRCRKAKPEEERLAAISAIKNLCDEPANLIPMTNTPDCIATLMHLAHGMEEGITELMQYRACDALATLSHWLRKIATSGQALENAKAKKPPPKTLFVPSLQVVDYNQWK